MGKDYIAALTEREGSGRTHSALGWSNVTATKLVQQYTLLGHRGCVNRLAWSEDGLLLLSGSDDRKLNLWCLHGTATESTLVVPTLHDGNIFGVQFLPQRNSKVLVSCSMDRSVQVGGSSCPASTVCVSRGGAAKLALLLAHCVNGPSSDLCAAAPAGRAATRPAAAP